eukprot:COSAG04_NODE_18052_length_452_cov_1.025496_2_plen_26_part_01
MVEGNSKGNGRREWSYGCVREREERV